LLSRLKMISTQGLGVCELNIIWAQHNVKGTML
jgi:hypothetical protein